MDRLLHWHVTNHYWLLFNGGPLLSLRGWPVDPTSFNCLQDLWMMLQGNNRNLVATTNYRLSYKIPHYMLLSVRRSFSFWLYIVDVLMIKLSSARDYRIQKKCDVARQIQVGHLSDVKSPFSLPPTPASCHCPLYHVPFITPFPSNTDIIRSQWH